MCVWVPFYPGRSVCVCLYPGRRFASLIRVPGYPSPLFLSESFIRVPCAPGSSCGALSGPRPLSESIIRVLYQSPLSESLSECLNESIYPSPLSESLVRVNCFNCLSESYPIRIPYPSPYPSPSSESPARSCPCEGPSPCPSPCPSPARIRACVRARAHVRACGGARACVRAGACLLGRTGLASYPSLLSESLIRVL